MRFKSVLFLVIILLLLLSSGWVIWYYWSVQSIDGIRNLPEQVMYVCLGYVLLQVLKRFLHRYRYWWDWIYYVGLASAMIPTFFTTSGNEGIMHFLTDFGTLFLIIPVLLDLITYLKNKI